ncbi:phospholipase D1-like [Gigantopelta aegis]|uniref:phospholipase D1-like n=1 Tax=Gigantopelta aegis TaxID=1735272 RepID=UPI001B88DCA5|nr:phospholipase D1-like [Gigantopelta aegis]
MDHEDGNGADELGTADTTVDFLRNFSVIEWESYESEDDGDFDELSPIPETPADHLDGDVPPRPPTTPGSISGNPTKSFKTIFEKPVKFENLRDNCWIPEEPVFVNIINHERQGTTKVMNPYLYTISVKHGDFRWTVRRRYKHFRQLHDALVLFRTRYRIPFPQKRYQERRRTIRREHQAWKDKGSKERNNARFPLRPEALTGEQNILERRNQLELYLQNVVKYKSYRNHSEMLRFFEVCHLSFVNKLGKKGKEGLIKKCSGGRRINISCCGCLSKAHIGGTWNRRWLVVKDTFLAYIRPEDGIVSDVMLMDSDFHVDVGIAASGVTHGVLISNLSRKLLIKCWTSRKAREWAQCLTDRSKTTAKDFTRKNRFLSYAPERENSYARWFVDGSSYFEAVADALEKAKEEIYISDWWLSPEIYLKRPMTEGDRWRLDLILQRKADAGVKIFILLYKEIQLALGINSIYSKQTLVSKHPENIKVLRHPDHGATGVLLWAHHEKVVVIDQKVAFLGGFDLCYGRWDNEQHRLIDLGSIALKSPTPQPMSTPIMTQIHNAESTDITELNDDLHSLSDVLNSPVHSRPAPHSPVHISVRPSTPEETSDGNQLMLVSAEVHGHHSNTDTAYETITPSTADTTETSVSGSSAVKSEERQSVQEAEHSEDSKPGQQSDASSDLVQKSGSKDAESTVKSSAEMVNSSDSVDHASYNRPSTNEVGEKHLWKNAATRKKLKLVIPKAKVASQISHHHTACPDRLEESKVTFDDISYIDSDGKNDAVDSIVSGMSNNLKRNSPEKDMAPEEVIVRHTQHKVEGSQRDSSDSSKSQGSQSELIARKEKRLSRSGNDIPDLPTAVVQLMAIRKLTKDPEPNNNNNNAGQEGQREAENQARRRWRMVLDVKKFESVVREPQTPEKISKQLMFGGQGQRHKFGKLGDKWQWHRERAASLKGLKLPEHMIHRTKSEEDIMQCGLEGSSKLWIGKDYVNFIYKDFVNLEHPFADFIDRSKCPRMPWHDIGTVVYGKGARDVARHFIARWNFTKLEKCKKNKHYPLLLPKNHVHCTVPQAIMNITFKVKAQILRSSGGWSAGIGTTESSIHEAYIHCIERAKHYVYIENQFFITQIGANTSVSNKVGEALFNRILAAHKKGELFRVYVVMPLLPAFEGEFGTATGTALSAVTHWNYASICRGGNSLIERLVQEVPDPMKYVIFCGLRTHSELAGKPITELIYVHSKMMIVDDDTVIIGSANINDRSLLGKRDSEIAILVEDRPDNKFPVRINGKVHMAGKFASSLRRTIFREHLGLRDDHVNITDIVCDDFYKDVWIKQAATNTTMFDKVFHCIPCDCVHKYSDLKQYQAENALVNTDMRQARECLSKIVGNIVLLPLHFLKDENLAPKLGEKEAMLPSYIWT